MIQQMNMPILKPKFTIRTLLIATLLVGVSLPAVVTYYDDVITYLWSSQPNYSRQEIFRRQRQKQLEKTIARFKTVESATVTINLPIEQFDSPAASVQIKVASKAKFGEADASAIASMVASSVSGLTVEQVSITVTRDNEYTKDSD
ncbi:hypothetical protein OAG68_01750 [bacterium]|nr:hypothetical protein [bacterium]